MIKTKEFSKALKFLASFRETVSSNLVGDTEYTDINFVNSSASPGKFQVSASNYMTEVPFRLVPNSLFTKPELLTAPLIK
jgi:hypothetical protein